MHFLQSTIDENAGLTDRINSRHHPPTPLHCYIFIQRNKNTAIPENACLSASPSVAGGQDDLACCDGLMVPLQQIHT